MCTEAFAVDFVDEVVVLLYEVLFDYSIEHLLGDWPTKAGPNSLRFHHSSLRSQLFNSLLQEVESYQLLLLQYPFRDFPAKLTIGNGEGMFLDVAIEAIE